MAVWPSHPSAPLLITAGEPAGIGGELTLLAARAARDGGLPLFATLDSPERLASLAESLGWRQPIAEIESPEEAEGVFPEALPVLRVGLSEELHPGAPRQEEAPAVIEAIARAVELVRVGEASAIVTNPIHKAVLMEAGFGFPGHTEYLGHLSGEQAHPVMMLAIPGLRVVPLTIHQPLASVAASITQDLIVRTARILSDALARDFAIAKPRLAVSGLNPHAGEEGALGREEVEIIGPACEALRAEGLDVWGPVPADSLFHDAARARYDAALCMYHDQALIPVKALDFDHGVNVTLGLPFVRASPDHGTAFDIAGAGKANPASFLEAIRLAHAMVEARAAAETADG